MDKFIVAEITKNWSRGSQVKNLISNEFEEVINVNAFKGYKLIDWKYNTIIFSEYVLIETIIAIFERIDT